MTALSNCKPWCMDHKTVGEDSCYTRFVIYDDGNESAEVEPGSSSLAAQSWASGGLPAEISWIAVVASQDDEDEDPLMDLQFYEAGETGEQNSILHVDMAGLKQLHSALGAILRDFSQPS